MKCHIAALCAAFALTMPGYAAADSRAQSAATVPQKIADTRAALRDLWVGHVFWVRNVVTARLAGDGRRAAASEEQVVNNARSIAASIEPFYGKAASERLFGLLAGHWGAISGYLEETKDANEAGRKAAYAKLVGNADDIAEFLGGANPHLPVATLRSLLTAHGAHHVQQINELDAGHFEQEAKTWEAMKNHMYVLSDALVTGIAAQFPEKFE